MARKRRKRHEPRASNDPISSLRGQGGAHFLSGFGENPVLIS